MGGTSRLASLVLVASIGATGLAWGAPAASAEASSTFYVSASGNDALAGTSPATAWRTLTPVNSRVLAGDTVLLAGGSTFAGPLRLDDQDAGATVGSFGTGRARILGNSSPGVVGYDVGSVTLRDLDLVGDPAAYDGKSGVDLYSDQPAGERISGVSISHLDVRGFKNGIAIGGANPGAGFAHVSVVDTKTIGNRDNGLITYGPAFDAASPSYANADVTVSRTTANKNLGNASDTEHNSGNGIVLGSVDGGSVTRSSASGNGARCTAPEGPAGIWTYDSRDIRIAHDTATGNRTGGIADGDGFDLDQNVYDSSLEHNTSSRNDGAGYLVYAGEDSVNHGNVVRWNTSHGDARNNSWYGGITLAGNAHTVTVTANKVDTRTSASHAPALSIKPGVTHARIKHNTLMSAAGYRVIDDTRS
ncbi:MAG TPA: right-handed parallel beta-helix repeat-containing protein [Mycobacteriales bacterium]|nr:right-handed parallel beta-helix repeat-containing protein [Mycobacteriales bacterium]